MPGIQLNVTLCTILHRVKVAAVGYTLIIAYPVHMLYTLTIIHACSCYCAVCACAHVHCTNPSHVHSVSRRRELLYPRKGHNKGQPTRSISLSWAPRRGYDAITHTVPKYLRALRFTILSTRGIPYFPLESSSVQPRLASAESALQPFMILQHTHS